MTDWDWVEFGDLYEVPSKNGMMAPSKVRGAGALLVNMREIFAFDRISNQRMERAPLPAKNSDAWLLRARDLLFARQSLTLAGAGKVSIVLETTEPMTFESHIIRVRLDPSQADPHFYYYLFRSWVGRSLVEGIVEQVAAAGIRASDLGRLKVPCPGLPEQQRIARVLGALDNLIEANRLAISRTRDLSRALYKQLASGSPEEVALGEVARVSDLKVKPASGSIRYIDIAALGDGVINLPAPIDWADAPSRARMGATDGSTLWSTVRPNRRAHGLLVEAPEDLVVSTGIAVLTPESIGPAELFAASDQDEFVDQLISVADGSAYPAVRPNAFAEMRIASLTPEQSAQFEQVLWPHWRDAHAAEEDNDRLVAARDELLPLLMSGKVRVSEDMAVA